MIAREKILPDLFAVVPDFLQNPNGVNSRQRGDDEQAPETGNKSQPGAQDKTVKSAVQTHIGCRTAVFQGRHDVHVRRLTQENIKITCLPAHCLKNTASLVYGVETLPFTVTSCRADY